MRAVLFAVWQCVWGAVQTFIGLVLFIINLIRKHRHFFFHGAVVTEWEYGGSVSLGMFIFVSKNSGMPYDELLSHEYGHSIQSLFLGILYLLIIGLPSLVWAGPFRKYRHTNNIPYDSFYTEKWATFLGQKFLTDKSEER